MMTRPYRGRARSKFLPSPQPSAVTRSASSVVASTFANVFGGERHPLRRQIVRVDVVANRLAETGAQAVLMRAARARGNAVDVAAEVLVGRLRPLQYEIEPRRGVAREHERHFVDRSG